VKFRVQLKFIPALAELKHATGDAGIPAPALYNANTDKHGEHVGPVAGPVIVVVHERLPVGGRLKFAVKREQTLPQVQPPAHVGKSISPAGIILS